MKNIYLLVKDIDVGRGGLTRVMLGRASYFADAGHNCNLLSVTFKDRHDLIYDEFIRTKRLSKKVSLLNLFDYYREKNTISEELSNDNKLLIQVKDRRYKIHSSELTTYRHVRYFDQDGRYIMYKKWHKNGHLQYIDYFKEDKTLYKKEEFCHNNYKTRTKYYDLVTKKLKMETYHTPDGYAYLTIDYNLNNESPKMIYYLDRDSDEVVLFSQQDPMLQFQKYWIEELCDKSHNKPFIINEDIFITDLFTKINKNKCYKISTTHNNHLNAPYVIGSPVKKHYEDLFNKAGELDAIVFLTKEQKEDVVSQFNFLKNVFAIPNALSRIEFTETINKDLKVISIVGRLEYQKHLEDAIEAFSIISKKHKDVILNIYGKGPDEEKLQRLI
ncbi:glycosyltransferase, partial [Heyndrickxia sporothermodurans]